jgi:hypothetical protein
LRYHKQARQRYIWASTENNRDRSNKTINDYRLSIIILIKKD